MAASACSSRTPPERERALQHIPAQAHVIVAADGPALATPVFRAILDAARPHIPVTLGCVVDAATTAESIAVGVTLDAGTTIVLRTRAVVSRCPALSQIAEDTWTATIGAGALAESRATSMLAESRWDRARPYLVREPFALAIELPALRAIAVAQPDPIDAWIAIDAADTGAAESAVRGHLARYQQPATLDLANKLAIARAGTQVTVQADRLTADDLAALVSDLLLAAERGPDAAPVVFTCPPPGNGIVSCHDGTQLKVSSVAELVRELGTVDAAPVAAGGDIIGIRLIGDPPRLLRRDDVLLGINASRVTESRQLAQIAASLDGHASVAVRREGIEVVLDLSE